MNYNLFQLEKLLIPFEEWEKSGCPSDGLNLAFEEHKQGIPTGIGFDTNQFGWFVIQSCGQGPILIWSEKK